MGFLRFKANGTSRGCPSLACMGGVLKDCSGNAKLLFSKSLGIDDSNLSKIMAIKEAFVLFVAFSWASSHSLIIEFDSMNVVKWCNNLKTVLW